MPDAPGRSSGQGRRASGWRRCPSERRTRWHIVGSAALIALVVGACAPDPPAPEPTAEKQRLTIDPSAALLRKTVALTLGFDGAMTHPIDALGFPFTFTPYDDWTAGANNYIFTIPELPTPADIDAALEALPGIGPGGVTVVPATRLDGGPAPGEYDITFPRPEPLISVPDCWTVLPLALLEGSLAELDDPSAPQVTLPPGLEGADAYVGQLIDQIDIARFSNDYRSLLRLIPELVRASRLQSPPDRAATIDAARSLFPERASVRAVG